MITAGSESTPREIIPAGNHVARCYSMIQIGTVVDEWMGKTKEVPKVRIGWELPMELRTFDENKGPQPMVLSREYNLYLYEKANLRKDLESWRGKAFTEEEVKAFDITKLMGVSCMVNVIHATKDGKTYANISGITPMPKGMNCPPQINPAFILSYDSWDVEKFNTLPDFIKAKMVTSVEYKALTKPEETHTEEEITNGDPLPF